jgi:hypothetical protein
MGAERGRIGMKGGEKDRWGQMRSNGERRK